MSRPPAWARDEQPTLEELSNAGMREEVAAERLHTRGVGHLPVDPATAAFEVTAQTRALRSSRPNRRWRALDKFDQEIARLEAKRQDAFARLHEAEEAVRQAPEHDAQTLAKWIAGGEKNKRPTASLYERERDRDAARLLSEAVTLELDRALETRQRHIEDNREKMIEDATGELEAAVGKLRAQSQVLPALRQTALEARAVLEWVASFPEPADSFGHAGDAALGLMKPIKRLLGIKGLLPFATLLEVLEEDASAIRNAFGDKTARALGIAAPRTPLVEAQWDVDVDPAWKAAQLERARGLLEWSPTPSNLADEAADFRP